MEVFQQMLTAAAEEAIGRRRGTHRERWIKIQHLGADRSAKKGKRLQRSGSNISLKGGSCGAV